MAEVGEGETLSERQEEELKSLEAIFMQDVSDLRKKDTWKVKVSIDLMNLFVSLLV